jgi:hypothetical protein
MKKQKQKQTRVGNSKNLSVNSTTEAKAMPPLHELLGQLKVHSKTLDSWCVVQEDHVKKETKEDKKECKELVATPGPDLGLQGLAKMMFKADHPYRTKLGQNASLTTSAAGVLNANFTVSGVSSAQEWSIIDQLFDEVFIHSMELIFQPMNVVGAGAGAYSGTQASGAQCFPVASGSGSGTYFNTGIQIVALFNGAGTYGSAQAMIPNPTLKIAHCGHAWKYFWRNNVKFSPRGLNVGGASGLISQGWMTIANVATQYGGSVQIRTMSDDALGDGAHTITPGRIVQKWDCSFRARS